MVRGPGQKVAEKGAVLYEQKAEDMDETGGGSKKLEVRHGQALV